NRIDGDGSRCEIALHHQLRDQAAERVADDNWLLTERADRGDVMIDCALERERAKELAIGMLAENVDGLLAARVRDRDTPVSPALAALDPRLPAAASHEVSVDEDDRAGHGVPPVVRVSGC